MEEVKTPEQMALEYAHRTQIFWDGEPIEHHIVVCKEMAFLAGYKAAKEEEATKDQKIAELWTESIRRMLPSVHEIMLFPSKQSKDK